MKREYYEYLLNVVKNGQADSDRHLLTLYSIALQISAKRILELGVREGHTTLPFLCAAAETGGTLHSVDISPTTFRCPAELSNHWSFFQSDAIQWLKAAAATGQMHYDLVYVDDWHSYQHVKQELNILESMISPSTVIILHDLMYSNAQPHYRSNVDTDNPEWAGGGPYRAVAELDPREWEWATIPVNHGLTILRKKAKEVLR
jgi:predicted O-methyltransferase YrrM